MKYKEEYDWKKIGARIKYEREKAHLSQSELMKEIHRSPESYRTLGRWEKGFAKPELNDIVELCNVFDCDVGYLLCDYDYRTNYKLEMNKVLGMSESSSELLKLYYNDFNRHYKKHGVKHPILNYFFDIGFFSLLYKIEEFIVMQNYFVNRDILEGNQNIENARFFVFRTTEEEDTLSLIDGGNLSGTPIEEFDAEGYCDLKRQGFADVFIDILKEVFKAVGRDMYKYQKERFDNGEGNNGYD